MIQIKSRICLMSNNVIKHSMQGIRTQLKHRQHVIANSVLCGIYYLLHLNGQIHTIMPKCPTVFACIYDLNKNSWVKQMCISILGLCIQCKFTRCCLSLILIKQQNKGKNIHCWIRFACLKRNSSYLRQWRLCSVFTLLWNFWFLRFL